MSDRAKVIVGLALFFAAGAAPVWVGLARAADARPLSLTLPPKSRPCPLEPEVMRREHPALLSSWRDAVLREGRDSYEAPDGRVFRMSLVGTCLGCHDRPAEFCDRCHETTGATFKCWSCHEPPAGGK